MSKPVATKPRASTPTRYRYSGNRYATQRYGSQPARKATVAKRYVARRNGRRSPVASRHYTRIGQQTPTQERISEIQGALSDKGYLSGDKDGKWDERTVEALKRFQTDQNLTADGKLSSLSLIALGLGPSRTNLALARLKGNPAAASTAPVSSTTEAAEVSDRPAVSLNDDLRDLQ